MPFTAKRGSVIVRIANDFGEPELDQDCRRLRIQLTKVIGGWILTLANRLPWS